MPAWIISHISVSECRIRILKSPYKSVIIDQSIPKVSSLYVKRSRRSYETLHMPAQVISPISISEHRIKIPKSPCKSAIIDQSILKVSGLYVEPSRRRYTTLHMDGRTYGAKYIISTSFHKGRDNNAPDKLYTIIFTLVNQSAKKW
jgi:hypothetical protein